MESPFVFKYFTIRLHSTSYFLTSTMYRCKANILCEFRFSMRMKCGTEQQYLNFEKNEVAYAFSKGVSVSILEWDSLLFKGISFSKNVQIYYNFEQFVCKIDWKWLFLWTFLQKFSGKQVSSFMKIFEFPHYRWN